MLTYIYIYIYIYVNSATISSATRKKQYGSKLGNYCRPTVLLYTQYTLELKSNKVSFKLIIASKSFCKFLTHLSPQIMTVKTNDNIVKSCIQI